MGNVEDNLKKYILEKYGSLKNFAEKINIALQLLIVFSNVELKKVLLII